MTARSLSREHAQCSHFRSMAEVSFLPKANTRKRASASRERASLTWQAMNIRCHGFSCKQEIVRSLQSWPKLLGHFLVFLKTEHFNISSLPLENGRFQESWMCHKYSTVKGRKPCLGEVGQNLSLSVNC